MSSIRFILACDDRGTTRWPSPTKTWAFGGLIFEASKRQMLLSVWQDVKLELCGDESCELKWSHFFPGHHQDRINNPLISKDPNEWCNQAKWALTKLFDTNSVLPLTTYVRKDKASDNVFRITEDGRRVLDINTIWVGVLGQFALFLNEKTSIGEIWFDQLGSQKEQERKQTEWIQLRDGDWPVNPENQLLLKRIASNFKFYDSQTEPIIQIADFVSGITWAASEGDEVFLLQTIDEFVAHGKHTYRLLKFE